ncbi:Vacuolar fusion protein mon1 [Penicillium digitatum PHI26]|uniref:Vacuolar fusion protein MON1 n=2 Tax=Penicillium digitatum TaxID=36651 RepID=K9GVG6_PEND2|nr:Vacuolar fusion protein mon1 [Penicillium digitatum Pd1]EKV16233.1 Vacuolar fusion protein mon1 [Penicillium digitatum Pd1]EKV18618.1 Vacuolar fusion protein mon1 [Penicillium digitatum PHI26]
MPAAGMNTQGDPNTDGEQPVETSKQPYLSSSTTPDHDENSDSSEGERPPLPPRPNKLSLLNDETGPRAALQAEATTAISRTDTETQLLEAVDSPYSALAVRSLTRGPKARASLSQLASPRGSEAGDSASIRSSIPNGDFGDVEALFVDFAATVPVSQRQGATGLLDFPEFAADDIDDDGIQSEFEAVGELNEEGDNEELLLQRWKAKRKHYVILSAAASTLLYGLLVAGGRLVSVVRPKKHSLHPGDLQLLFNMIFEADGVKAGGGECWIPVCLPGFNSSGYLYMYVSFLDIRGEIEHSAEITKDESVAIVLISPDKEAFFEMQGMRDALLEQMEKNGSLKEIKTAIDNGRPATTDIVPGTVLHHFLYKSRANVQFTMSSYAPEFSSVTRRRR